MTDLSATLEAKVDQLTADELMGGPRNITVARVSGNDDAAQPISIHFEGDNGKPFKPCLTMRRLLVKVWGPDGSKYAGRSLTVYRDPEVSYGGLKTGGVRISHVSEISEAVTVALTKTRGKKAPITVKPLKVAAKVVEPPFDVDEFMSSVLGYIETATDPDELAAWWSEQRPEWIKAGKADREKALSVAESVKQKIESFKTETEN